MSTLKNALKHLPKRCTSFDRSSSGYLQQMPRGLKLIRLDRLRCKGRCDRRPQITLPCLLFPRGMYPIAYIVEFLLLLPLLLFSTRSVLFFLLGDTVLRSG